MTKLIVPILVLYFLYYCGNILYDLFLKKEKVVATEESTVYSLSDFAENHKDETTEVGIEDVENINTPKSFIRKELSGDSSEAQEERPDIAHLRERFESEQDLDEVSEPEETYESPSGTDDKPFFERPTTAENKQQEETVSKGKSKDFKKMLNLSETMVQLVANYDGQKVYHSTM